ncbi:MAG: carbamoyltransferase C-terminal domain-containing protein [Bdellovibrionales bacterium]|jgi:carbamoyltransferase
MDILGLSCFDTDSAACLVRDGVVVAAAEEERFSRLKHEDGFPENALRYVLQEGGITGAALDAVVFYEKPALKLKRLSGPQAASYRENTQALAARIQATCGASPKLIEIDHALSHAALAFYTSPFQEAAILVVDGVGEVATTSLYRGQGSALELVREVAYPHSLGLFYTAITSYLGFEAHEGEYKVMGLAPYGQPLYRDVLSGLIAWQEDGGFTLDLSCFSMDAGELEVGPKLAALLGGAPREPEAPLSQRHKDIAASLQKVMEEALLHLAQGAKEATGLSHLCLTGEMAHNIVANARLRDAKIFDDLFIPFAAGDGGAALGAALQGYYALSGAPRRYDRLTPYLGPAFSDEACRAALDRQGVRYEVLPREALLSRVAKLLAEDKVVGWFQGRMEFGPRALGNRSLLANARRGSMKETLNERVKHREAFRPFAPVVLVEQAATYFELEGESPAMLYAAQVRPDQREVIPAVTHIDGSARPQTLRREDNPLFYDLIVQTAVLTGVPVLVNTSFNRRGEPIVASPDDALTCFKETAIDALVLGSFLVVSQQGAKP